VHRDCQPLRAAVVVLSVDRGCDNDVVTNIAFVIVIGVFFHVFYFFFISPCCSFKGCSDTMPYVRQNNANPSGGRWGGPASAGGRKFKPLAPKNSANQAAWDRLKEHYENAKSENYERTLAKALKSLAASKDPIKTFKDALALKNVGQHCARIICPVEEGEAPTVVAKPAATKRKKQLTPAQEAAAAKDQAEGEAPRPASRKRSAPSDSGPSVKEANYQKAKQDAEAKWTHPIRCPASDGLLWKVILLVDGREPKSQHMLSKCSMSGIPAEERHLPIGDMAWIAQGLRRERHNGKITTTVEVELLLGTIIERKTTEDLVSSLFGTRFMEQRLRLQHCGLPQVLFLIEGDIQKDVHPSFPKERLQTALMETRVYLGFQITFAQHMEDTVLTLKRIHRRILQRAFPQAFGMTDDALPSFASPDANHSRTSGPNQQSGRRRQRRPASLVEMVMDTPPVPAFGESRFMTYTELKCKIERDREAGTRTVGAIHGAMLRQVCGNQKIKAIRLSYPTPASLLQAYDQVADNPKEQSELVANCAEITAVEGSGARKVGPKTSSEVYVAYCTTSNPQPAAVSAALKRSSPEKPAPVEKSADLPSLATSARPEIMQNEDTTTRKASSVAKDKVSLPTAAATHKTDTKKKFEPLELLLTSDDDDNDVEKYQYQSRFAAKKQHEDEKENNNVKPVTQRNQRPLQDYKQSKDTVVMLDDSSDDDDEADYLDCQQKTYSDTSDLGTVNAVSLSLSNNHDSSAHSSQNDDSLDHDRALTSLQFAAGATALDAIEIE
jgi:ERCC4-type nuclease